MPDMCSYRKLCLVAIFILPPAVAGFSQTSFPYFKNTKFHQCTPSNLTSTPLPDQAPTPNFSSFTTRSLTPSEFCDAFWNYTVIPTKPTDAAFSFTWLSCLSNCLSFFLSSFLLWRTATRHGKPIHEYHPLLPANATRPPPAKPISSHTGLGKLFWITLAYDTIKTCFWWVSFSQLVRWPTTAARISLLQWITTYQYRITLREVLSKKRMWLVWLPLALCILQFGCSIFAALLMAQSLPLPIDGQTSFSTITYHLTNDPLLSPAGESPSCSLTEIAHAVILSDPSGPVRQLIYFLGSLIAVLLFVPSAVIDLRGQTTRRFMWAYQVYAIGAVQGIMALVIALVRLKSTPLSWDDRCAVVHVMMSPSLGYWDVELSRLWRILMAWLNV